MLHPHLRSPSPEIARIGEGGVTQRGKGSRRKWREEGSILPSHKGSLGPIQAHRRGAEAHQIVGDAVRGIGEPSHEVKVHIRADLSSRQGGTVDFQTYLGLPQR